MQVEGQYPVERQYPESKGTVSVAVNPAVKDCLVATQMFSKAIGNQEKIVLAYNLKKTCNLDSLPKNIVVRKLGSSGETIASLYIDFFENRIVTNFQGRELSNKLSNVLGLFGDLSEIFAKIVESDRKVRMEDEVANALDAREAKQLESNKERVFEGVSNALAVVESSKSNVSLAINGKDVMTFRPSIGRVTLLTSRGQSSVPLPMIQDCAHLFNRAFADHICSLLGVDSTITGLTNGIYNLYLGRCILGLVKTIFHGGGGGSIDREFVRIGSLIQIPGSQFYTEPFQ
jgi:hypothetical protein